ncbi:2-oxoacid:acceptor oxidoreductase subunit alpha [Sulfurimonas sp. HSL-1656]|uniref:2-oxoacid:acceptor oxidoreductase subunit alpha n=1 Tax=Thiomicrolovo subterrani TaxID=3131934 RepID=UPI0031F9FD55
MTSRELAAYDGRDGRPAYVAYKGKVYDVSESPMWAEGNHQGMHRAGRDLTPMLEGAPHGEEVFERYSVVGTLEAEPEQTARADAPPPDPNKERRRRWQALYRRYHPHPMTVHFPIALHLFASLMDLLFFAAPTALYAAAVFYTFLAATVMGAVAMVPGLISWRINYGGTWRRPFAVKIILSTLMLLAGVVAIVLYMEEPGIVYTWRAESIAYHAIVLLTGAGVIVLGYYGGKITWGESMPYPQAQTDSASAFKAVSESAPSPGTDAKLSSAGRYEVPFAAEASLPPFQRSESGEPAPSGAAQSLSILIGGAAGMGIDTMEKLLSDAFVRSGYYVYSSKEFMSRVRGGSNTTLIRIADAPQEAPCWEVDLFIALDALALTHAAPRLTARTVVLADERFAAEAAGAIAVAMQREAQRLGDPRYANTYAAGLVYGMLGLETPPLMESVEARFGGDRGNLDAVQAGAEAGRNLQHPPLPPLPHPHPEGAAALHLMDGTTACGFGFLAGGCNFVASYPMSPSTGVLNFMAGMSKRFEIAVEQSEDEIASIHLVMGAWYAGARALTTTSGGGFALMGEGISLSGITETPAVVYLAQRPGPATGLPTRSEQGDLNLALHSGHGPFPRIILAPGSLHECVELGHLAFELADRWQVPVIVLSDQYLADTMAMTGDIDFSDFEQRRYIAPASETYHRYADTPSGVSPRAVPGGGEGLVCSDGHEHDARGQITEDFRVREAMVAKRARKAEGIVAEAWAPEVRGAGSIAVIGWGSSRGAIAEALAHLGDDRTCQVHFAWVHPLDPEQLAFLQTYEYRIVVENNADGAFAEQLALHGVGADRRILQSNGFAYFADQLAGQLAAVLKELS